MLIDQFLTELRLTPGGWKELPGSGPIRQQSAGGWLCPLMAVPGAGSELPFRARQDVIKAADKAFGHDPQLRARLEAATVARPPAFTD